MATNLDLESKAGAPSLPANQLPAPFTVESGDAATRKWVSYILIAILAALILAAFVDLFIVNGPNPAKPNAITDGTVLSTYNNAIATDSTADADRLLRLLNIIFGPVVTLVSSVVGFYFGARTAKEGSNG
ncbi:hypothetical protein FPZ24_09065 [Sphingomonas panacisoli]|uniref:Uncharacterized protein n=1 Tax=Sphingomonas panacisoli TaxID=1813879 RepID=A0A5B8LHU6_9SPHN|nr:hypothetical protein [Sphingomonas panacisoli]QDZ07621.1 hypothetical protein FPZ24_09065 [Sphingomonas panacisoli]